MRIYWGRNLAGFKRPSHVLMPGQELVHWRVGVQTVTVSSDNFVSVLSAISEFVAHSIGYDEFIPMAMLGSEYVSQDIEVE